MSAIPERLAALRERMREHELTHYFVPSADEHLDEYLPPWRQRREWISGFSGSAGDVLVGLEDAWLFTDGRYHIQAAKELAGSGVSLSKVGVPGHLTLIEHLVAAARSGPDGLVLGADPMVVAIAVGRQLEGVIGENDAEGRWVSPNLIDEIWEDAPQPVCTELVPLPAAQAGRTTAEKLADVRAAAAAAGANTVLVVKLDQLAWLLNMRSREDVPYNPVFEGFGCVGADRFDVFLHGGEARMPAAALASVDGLRVHEYEALEAFLEQFGADDRVLLDASGATVGLELQLEQAGAERIFAASPVEHAKSIKNPTEQQNMRRANRLASLAKTRALRWLEQRLDAGDTVSERSFLEEIERGYAVLPEFWGLSFNTISATGSNGAIMHYADAGEVPLRDGELFLIDSGVQVAGGTTDDTRTVAVGAVAEEQRRLYTHVLQCHIAAASLTFPEGTPGSAVDAVCRQPLWRAGLDYDHGTGHGVGCFLNVHEGPFAISETSRKPYAATPLHEGMVTSIEPGYYREGWGGIRLENLYLLAAAGKGERGGTLLRFEPLTFIPFDARLIDRSMLSPGETEWLDAYHQRVAEELAKEAPAEEVAALLPRR
ncbi:MAG TPA: M24 family metallopeptidase [Planctomycetota bacterium]